MSEKSIPTDRAATKSDGVLGKRGKYGLLTLGILAVIIGPIVDVIDPFWFRLLVNVLVFALFAASLDLVFGYTGLPSFGHAAMFGAGGYAAALLLLNGFASALVVLPIAILVTIFISVIIGWISARTKDLYFSFITLAFAQILFIAAFIDLPARILSPDRITRGDDGLVGVPAYDLGVTLTDPMYYYFFTLVVVAAGVYTIIAVANSPFGRVLRGIHENEERMRAIGYNVTNYKVLAFTISGALTGLAGALYVPHSSVAHPNLFHWLVSGELVIIVLVGGMGSIWGPMVAAGLFVYLEHVLSAFANWLLILGLIYVVFVIFVPDGLSELLKRAVRNPRDVPNNAKRSIKSYINSVRYR
ncbi:branched-chain amino acid ABC transporter permease [Natrarchaeobius oligotrophus]|uniref:Branched-chain amino acid ABC transporter permease n=1 Tax=Natrarchaeobius chitinivorans TaxID=1679083 RepID=A0A3N6MF08_NATCH|nr:branched-chain amino acid ABC transporter permease [Natrarchaeobius chitinivorans]RQG99474.1 branched-chain amino acid ABC transporter permease [Natrarchaeobius chitinivorans]